jgi:non-ribosomal peptide synthetase component F
MHHIISDGWSSGIMIKEFAALYKAFISGSASPLEELSVQYADFAAWQRQWLRGDVLDAQLAYWKRQLSGAPALLKLPTDRPRPAAQSFKGASYTFKLDEELTASLKAFSRREGVTLFVTLLAVFQTLLHRYSRQDDVLVGTDVANRNWLQTEGLIGFFINQVVMRSNFANQPTFRDLLTQVRETALEAYAHQDLPFERLVEELNPDRNLSHAPLFQVKLVLQNVPLGALELSGLTLEPLDYEKNTSQLDFIMSLNQTERRIVGEIEYSTDLFDESTIDRLRQHFEILLRGVMANPDQRIADLRLLAGEELTELSHLDFADADLSLNDLENVLMEINRVFFKD